MTSVQTDHDGHMGERNQPNRRRCLTTGCNPVMHGDAAAAAHTAETGHRTAKCPQRSAAGKAKARERNRTGYYDKYNVGEKSAEARGIEPGVRGARPSVDESPRSGLRRFGGLDLYNALRMKGDPIAQGEDGEDHWGDSTGGY